MKKTKQKSKIRPFRTWDRQDIQKHFGISRTETLSLLETWLAANEKLSDSENAVLENFRIFLSKKVDCLNEEELKMLFISKLINSIDFFEGGFRPYFDRKLSAKIQKIRVSGIADFMIAKGDIKPESPYFCFHEYKKAEGGETVDTLGQLLIAMLAAQTLNRNEKPIYGAYIIGRNWFFVVLDGENYAVSEEFVATRSDIFQIYKMLKYLKTLIKEIS